MSKLSAIDRAIIYIKSNWKQGKTLKEVAQLNGVDAGNLERSFRNRKRMTFKQFVDRKRKAHVIFRLKRKKAIMGYEIGVELGFADDLAFYRWVRRAFGISWAALRSQVLRKLMTRKRNKK